MRIPRRLSGLLLVTLTTTAIAVAAMPKSSAATANVIEDNFERASTPAGAGWGTSTNSSGVTNRGYTIYQTAQTGYHIQSHSGQSDSGAAQQGDAFVSGFTQSGGDALLEFSFSAIGSARADLILDGTTSDSSLYQLDARSLAGQLVIGARVGGGSYFTCGTPASYTFAAGVVYWMRFDVTTAGAVRGRVWPAGAAEPSSWQTSCTNTQLTSGAAAAGFYWENPQPAGAHANAYCYAVARAGALAQPCGATAPVISAFTPGQGDVGYQVTITGAGFSRGTAAVDFNGVPAAFTVISDTAITATVPAGATTGPLTVTTADGTATAPGSYTAYPRPDFPGLADTSTNVHLFMPFDTDVSNVAALTTSDPPVDMVWGFNSGNPTADPSVTKLLYVPFDRDENPAYYPQAHNLAWYEANHPDWIEYQCDRTTVAYEFGDPNVPLDTTNPAVQQYIEQTYLEPALAAGSGYDGIAFDNLQFDNGGSWSGERCGHYDTAGDWVQQYNGTANDPAYRAAVISWAATTQAWFAANEPGKVFGANFSPDPGYPQQTATLLSSLDLDFDENGFTNGDSAPPWQYTDANWQAVTSALAAAARSGHGLVSVNQEPVPFASLTDAQVQWAIANYLLVKNSASGIWICGPGQYGQLLIRPEYAAATVGTPTGDYYLNQGVYRRDFTTGLALVNPSATATYTVTLPAGPSWYDLYGNPQGATVTLGPAAGLVLVHR